MDKISSLIENINDVMVAYVLVISLVGIGLFFTFYLGFPQIRLFFASFKESFGELFSKDKTKGISSLQAMMISISAQVGTGNIIGVATAIHYGGAGAIFWMWFSAFLGMSTILAEALLAQKYKIRKDDHYIGGPAFYISIGLKDILGAKMAKAIAVFFAISIIFALGMAGQMTQSNSIAQSVNRAFGVDSIYVAACVAIIAGFVVIGGVKRIAKFAEIIVPLMAIFYIMAAVFILFKFSSDIGLVFKRIFYEAFGVDAITGGAAGIAIKEAVRYGVARGLFANEAGMGSTPHAHASANVKNKASQGLVASLAVFIDTMIICTATALIILLTGANDSEGGIVMTTKAFITAFGEHGPKFLAVALTFFAFTTIIGWYYFARTNVIYLFGYKAVNVFSCVFLCCVFAGAFLKIDFVWNLSDLCNTLMVLPNILALILLAPKVKQMLKEYK